jgi:hypothetical protein
MSAQLTRHGTSRRSGMGTTSRAALRTRPLIQRIFIRSWEYIPAFRIAILNLRLLAALVLAAVGNALLSSSTLWGLVDLAAACGVVAFGLWIFTTARKGWPAR